MGKPSKRYWEVVKTKKDYDDFVGSGMAWELEPNTPDSWHQHMRLKAQIFCERVEKAHKDTKNSKLRFGGKNG